MSNRLQSALERATTDLRPKAVGLVALVLLVWYITLGVATQLRFPAIVPPMFELNIYRQALARALQHLDPYSYTDIWTAFLYPLPALLITGIFSLVRDDIPRAAFSIALNSSLLAVMLRGIAARYGYSLERIWWWFPLAFGFAPLLELLHVGQINLISSFGIYLMFLYASARPIVSGIGLALAAVTKLTPAAFLAYLIVLRRERALAWTIVFLALAYVVSFIVFGWQSPALYLAVVSNLSQRFESMPNAMALVSSLTLLGWIEPGAWPAAQRVLLAWTAIVFAASGISAWFSQEFDPLFVVMNFGIVVAANILWYHHYVFLLLPIFVWMGWSRLNRGVIAWCFLGMLAIQVDRNYWTAGLLPHVFAQLSVAAIVCWQVARLVRSRPKVSAFAAVAGVAAVLLMGALVQAVRSANADLVAARDWIDRNIPGGAHIAVESNGPVIDTEKYRVQVVADLAVYAPDWYSREGWQFLVTGNRSAGLFSQIPYVSAASTQTDQTVAAVFPTIAELGTSGAQTRIFETGAVLPAQRVYARWGVNSADWLELVGYDVVRPALRPGDVLNLTLYWRSILRRRDGLELTIHLLDSNDRDLQQSRQNLFPAGDPTGRWPEGITRVSVAVTIPTTASPGVYRVELQVAAPDTLGSGYIPLLSREFKPLSDKLFIGPFKVSPPNPARPVVNTRSPNATFGTALTLRDYALDAASIPAGKNLGLKLLWQSRAKMDQDYTVFLHLLDADGNIRAQVDSQPYQGAYPTSLWDAGEWIADEYVLVLPATLPPGDYRIQIGLYAYPSLARLPVTDAQGQDAGDNFALPENIKVTFP
ncbi:MAG: DUF2029 domain-containing protein [Chloroflexi bacterium]|nr:DUF2029 domain-containing protein [Chloroflexota bacterium]